MENVDQIKEEEREDFEILNLQDKNMEINPEFCEVKSERFEDTGGTVRKKK